MAKCRTLAHNPFEVHLTADLVFEIQLFLRQSVLQVGNLTVRERILHTDCHLIRDLNKEANLVVVECVLHPSRDCQYPK